MKLKIIAIGNRMPDWVNQGFNDYAKRMPRDYPVELIEIPLQKRQDKQQITQQMERETQHMLKHIKPSDQVVALCVEGRQYSTEEFAHKLQHWQYHELVFLIGGPEGLHPQSLARANEQLSLSNLTLPHPLARLVLVEQLYRAWSILSNHPYHRA
ncbi:MAG: 23S rRNA (pseudouridine(1915)-N(3))-methyltransferase RlmH [Legionellales bacterium]|nr:23S rRNA (pseudouridine(1915)-N(3))-methyltransferase RlmH [Legionellales bacterium]